MNVLLRKPLSPAQVSRQTMQRFMIRSEAEKEWERWREKRTAEIESAINNYSATLLWMFHTKHGYGAKRLRQLWEDVVQVWAEFRQFYRGSSNYVEAPTGENVEDYAMISALKGIGVDIEAWEQERFEIDEVTGEVKWENSR